MMDKRWKEFDLNRAKKLMDFIVEAGKHGPLFNRLMGLAQEELKEMVAALDGPLERPGQPVTPAAGPANALVLDKNLIPVGRTEPNPVAQANLQAEEVRRETAGAELNRQNLAREEAEANNNALTNPAGSGRRLPEPADEAIERRPL